MTEAVEDIARTLYGGLTDAYIDDLQTYPERVAAWAREKMRDAPG